MAADFGPFSSTVGIAGSLVAAVGALALSWRGRAKWEPDEEDVSRGAQKVAGLVSVIGVGVLWALYHDATSPHETPLLALSFSAAGVTVGALLIYGMLIAALTYDALKPRRRKIIGGFVLTPFAKKALSDLETTGKPATMQEIFASNGYEPDKVWNRVSRAAAKQTFAAAYILLSVSGTLGIASVALFASASMRADPVPETLETPECGSQGCWFVAASFKQEDHQEANRWLADLKSKEFKIRAISPTGKGIFLECGPFETAADRDKEVERYKVFFPKVTPFITNNPDKPW